ncbi:hypothetical protein [Kitasatospora sp. A2-31]|uniref:hypothetical protein n=1 Tax=Kitasatospora sp. A2-31 TaxID=2916414 RepID=UPI001EEA3D13|nr:hypothetical protein [Kitasatospora sp. A2-31]MCG6497922.1 hypothetical protein [Kitasatospora sp. A2-31]
MQLHASFRQQRRHLWLPALALAGAALAGCSSGSSKVVAASPAGSATSGSATSAPAAASGSAPAAPTGGSAAAPTAAPTAPPGSDTTGTAGSRPKDACTLVVPAQVAATINAVEPLNTTRPDAASDGSPVWGCTWGNRQSYASLREVAPGILASAKADPAKSVAPLPGVGTEAVIATRKDHAHPVAFFVTGGHTYEVEVVKDRGPGDAVNAGLEAAAEGSLALVFAKSLGG